MFKLTKYVIPLVVVILLGFLLWRSLSINPHEIPSALINQPAPEFSLPLLGDKNRRLSNTDLKNKVSMINVWASWCGACRAEHEYLQLLATDKRIRLFGLNYKDESAAALASLQRYGNPYEKVATDDDGQVAIEWGVYGTPETFILDENGRIRYKHVGPIDQQTYVQEILPLIATLTVKHHDHQ